MQAREVSTLSDVDIARIAREIARDLKPLQVVLDGAGINLDGFDKLQRSDFFQSRLVEEAQLWAGTTKTTLRERVATKAAMAIEELMADAIALVKDKDLPGAARVQALQFIAKLGHLGEGTQTQDDGSGRVMINIIVGGKKIHFDKETTDPKQVEGEFTDVTSEVSA